MDGWAINTWRRRVVKEVPLVQASFKLSCQVAQGCLVLVDAYHMISVSFDQVQVLL